MTLESNICCSVVEIVRIKAYIDLKKVFDMVHRASLWEILRLRRILTMIIGLIASLNNDTESAVVEACRAFFLLIQE